MMKMILSHIPPLMIALLLVSGCKGESDAPPQHTELREDGSLYTQINASDDDEWVTFDLDNPDAKDGDKGWDLAFRRQEIKLSGEADVAIAIVEEKSLDEVEGRPAEDAFFKDEGEDEKDLAFSQEKGWYSYNIVVHKLSPRDRTYVVRSSEGELYKLQFLSYYDDEKRGGFPSFVWDRLTGDGVIEGKECVVEETLVEVLGNHDVVSSAPFETDVDEAGVTTASIDAGLGGPIEAPETSYLYIDLSENALLPIHDQEARRENLTWDIAIKRSVIRVNSADSGAGDVVVFSSPDTSFEQAKPPALDDPGWRPDEFVSDECEVSVIALDFLDTAFGQWYDYDFEGHEVSVREDLVYFVHDRASEEMYALQIVTYEDGAYTMRWREVELP